MLTINQYNFRIPGQVGLTEFSFVVPGSPFISDVSLTDIEEQNFFGDLMYLNLRSEKNKNGEIRGQLITIDYPDQVYIKICSETN
jgi:hypothetical protein